MSSAGAEEQVKMSGSMVLAWLSLVWPASPMVDGATNDDCVNAVPIAGQGTFAFDNTNATLDGPPESDCGYPTYGDQIPYDVWYCWTAPLHGDVAVDTCTGTTVNTKVAVYEGCDCSSFPLEVCDDDACGYQSSAVFTATAGASYLIRIGVSDRDLISGGTGTFVLTYGPTAGERLSCEQLVETCRTPDHANALNSNRYDFAVADNFTPEVDGIIEDVCWWGAYANEFGEYVNAPLDTFEVSYYLDDGGMPGALVAGPFAQLLASLTLDGPVLTPGRVVGAYREYEYRAWHAPVPVFAGECYWLEITNASYYLTEWHWGTSRWGDGRAMQDGAIDGGPDGYDAADAVGLDLAFCLDLPLVDAGDCIPVPVNDECFDAFTISTGPTFFETIGASTDGPVTPGPPSGDYSFCGFALGDGQIHNDIWFEYEPPCFGSLTVDLCECSFDTKVAVYRAGDCPPIDDPVACNDDFCGEDPALQSQVSLEVTDSSDYKIRVGGYDWAVGAGTIWLDFVAVPPSDTNLYDYAKFTTCLIGPCGDPPCSPPLYTNDCCQAQDFESDGDVDLADYAALQMRFVGP